MSSQFSLRSLIDLVPAKVLDRAALTKILQAIELRLKSVEGAKADLDLITSRLLQVGLDRINEVLTPAIMSILRIQERGFLIANSATPGTLALGNILSLMVGDADERDLFTPAPFVALTLGSGPDSYGVARTISYDREDGTFVCEVLAFEGDPGPHSDWVIGALAGPTLAMIMQLAEARIIQTEVAANRAYVEATSEQFGELAEIIENGAVITVNGKSGSVLVRAGDINLDDDSQTIQAAIAARAKLDGPAFTGAPQAPTAAQTSNSDRIATTGFVKAATSALADLTAPRNSPTFTGTPTAPTPTAGTNTQQIANTAFVQASLAALVASSSAALDTLNELAAALGNDPNFAATISTAMGNKAAKDLSNVDPATGRAALGIGSMALRNVTVSTAQPSGGADGDFWAVVV